MAPHIPQVILRYRGPFCHKISHHLDGDYASILAGKVYGKLLLLQLNNFLSKVGEEAFEEQTTISSMLCHEGHLFTLEQPDFRLFSGNTDGSAFKRRELGAHGGQCFNLALGEETKSTRPIDQLIEYARRFTVLLREVLRQELDVHDLLARGLSCLHPWGEPRGPRGQPPWGPGPIGVA